MACGVRSGNPARHGWRHPTASLPRCRRGLTAPCAGRSSRWSRTTPASSTSASGSTTSAARIRRGVPQRGRVRRLLPDEGPVPSPQRVARRPRLVRRTGRRLPQARHGRHRAHRSACHLRRRRTKRIPDWIAVDARRQAAPPLGLSGDVGDLRPRPVQLRVHDRGDAGRSSRPTSVDGDLHQPLGRLRDVLLRALPEELPRRLRPRAAAHQRSRRTRRAAPTSSGTRSGSSISGGCGTRRCARSTPTRAFIPNTGGGATSALDMKRIGELAADAVRRSPGAARGHGSRGPTGRTAKEYRATHGPQADRRHLQRRRRGAVSLEGLGAKPGERSASGWPTASPTACGPGSPSSPACSTTGAG